MSVSAVVLTCGTYVPRQDVDETIVHVSEIRTPFDLMRSRIDAARKVRTSHFFFLDDDDDLPDDFASVLCQCLDARAAVAYTDREDVDRGVKSIQRFGPYSQDLHLRRPRMVHQLAVFNTEKALEAASTIPRGNYCVDLLLGWQVAKMGAAYVPRVGYRWVRGNGLHRSPATSFAQGQALLWCMENR